MDCWFSLYLVPSFTLLLFPAYSAVTLCSTVCLLLAGFLVAVIVASFSCSLKRRQAMTAESTCFTIRVTTCHVAHCFFFARLLSLGQGRHATVVMIVGSAHLCAATAKKIALTLSVVLVLISCWPKGGLSDAVMIVGKCASVCGYGEVCAFAPRGSGPRMFIARNIITVVAKRFRRAEVWFQPSFQPA